MGKYSDCLIYTGDQEFPPSRSARWMANLTDQPVFRSCYTVHWHMPFDPADAPKAPPGQRVVGHPPHIHKENEIMFMLSSDPENTDDLGAEVEICLGPEMEKYTITRSCCLRIPAGLPHGFCVIKACTRPFLMVSVQEANPRTEKFLWEYLTQEEIDSIPEHLRPLWVDVGFDD